jgi:hypothetical protein
MPKAQMLNGASPPMSNQGTNADPKKTKTKVSKQSFSNKK